MGGIIWPVVLDQLFLRNSFTLGVRVTAAITGVLLIIANFLMKPRSLPCGHQLEASKLAFLRILRDGPYLISIGAAFLVNLGLFFPCKFHNPSCLRQRIEGRRLLPPAVCYYSWLWQSPFILCCPSTLHFNMFHPLLSAES